MSADQTSNRRRLALSGLILGPVLLSVDELVQPDGGDGAEGMANAVAGSPDAWLIGWTLTMLGAAFMIPGIAAISARVGPRRAGLTTAGVILYGAGVLGLFGVAVTELLLVPVIGDDPAAATSVVERMNDSSALATVFLLYLPGWLLGLPLLLGGLLRSGLAPWWALAAGIGSVLLNFVLPDVVPFADVVAGALLLLAFAGVLTHRPAARVEESSLPARSGSGGPVQPGSDG